MTETYVHLANGGGIGLDELPVGDFFSLKTFILEKIAGGSHLAALLPFPRGGETTLLAVLTMPGDEGLALAGATIDGSFPSLTPECLAAHAFEREMAEQWNIIPVGHPWLKPLRFHQPYNGKVDIRLAQSFGGRLGPSVMDYFRVEGEEVHEVAVGPVHAGVIEPGHFRFQCHGEKVMHLEISLGYQYRGVEQSLVGGPGVRTRHLMETAAGDTTCGHAIAYAMAVEALAELDVSAEVNRVRSVGLELERLANHVGDLGALAGDIGFLPTANYCGRLRGDMLNLTALVCGNRFGRGLVVPGGVGYGIDGGMAGEILSRLEKVMRDVWGAIDLLFATPSVLARFEETGPLKREVADHLGIVGPAARASGLATDVRLALPFAAYRRDMFKLDLGKNGDVFDRASQRRREISVSYRLLKEWLAEPCDAPPAAANAPELRPNRLAVALTEGWRGQICHVAVTGADGKFAAYKMVDPSFHNWIGLAMAMRGQQISDFPLVNKSFNLSYCGHDL